MPIQLSEEIDRTVLSPGAIFIRQALADKSHVSAMFGSHQRHHWIFVNTPVPEGPKRNEWIILGVDDQRRHLNLRNVWKRTRIRIIINCIAKSIVRLKEVVPLPKMLESPPI